MFDRLMALWVFTATFLTSIVLVPIFMGLYYKGRRTPLAGVMSSAFGLGSVIAYYFGISYFGVANELYGTYIWTFDVGSLSIDLWQEYGLFFSLPMSLLGFAVGNAFSSAETIAPTEAPQ
jgi:hypothetical protein